MSIGLFSQAATPRLLESLSWPMTADRMRTGILPCFELLLRPFEELPARHARQHEVEDDQVGTRFAQLAQCLEPVARLHNRVPLVMQQIGQQGANW